MISHHYHHFCLLIALFCYPTPEAWGGSRHIDITRTSLEELINIEVVSVSKAHDPYLRSPSAIYVLTADDIRSSGVRSIPDALRLIPGVHVASIDGNKWAVSIRGFASRSANKLLVLIDGRSVYDPLFSGVFWEAKDVMLDNVERIEVIRGPGGTQWGINAVNGVINIITKNARDTQGSYAKFGAGTENSRFTSARQGWQTASGLNARIYAKYNERGQTEDASHDAHHMARTGVRLDHPLPGGDQLTIAADVYRGSADEKSPLDYRKVNHSGYNFVTRWSTASTNIDYERSLQFYYDWFEVDHWAIGEKRRSYAFEYHDRYPLGGGHSLNWGAEYRYTHDDIRGTPFLGVRFPKRSDETYSLRAVDEIWLVPARHKLDLGAKFEHNDYTGLEIQPSAHYAWYPNSTHNLWASVARAVRTPSRLESDATGTAVQGNPNLGAETLTAYELGYRLLPSQSIFIDATIFYNDYSELVTRDSGTLGNLMAGNSQGFELALRTTPAPTWRLDFSYSYLDLNLELQPGSNDITSVRHLQGGAPRHQLSFQTAWRATPTLETDLILRYVDELPGLGVEAYAATDIRVAWRFHPHAEVAAAGRNLFAGHHYEQAPSDAVKLPASAYVELILQI